MGVASLVGALGSLGGLGGLSSLTGGLGNTTLIPSSVSGATAPIASAGEVGVLLGIATIAVAVMIYRTPSRHQLWGALVLTFSVLSWVTSIGGLVIGFLLGIIGGVLAVTWKPGVAAPAPPSQITRICPNCGTVIEKDARFCSYCGKSLP